MMVLKLLKFFTDEKAFKLFVLTLILGLVVPVAQADELGESLEVEEYRTCEQRRAEVSRVQRELNEACSEAGLGRGRDCIQTLRDCEGSDASENSQCLEGMTLESDVRRDRKRLEELKEQKASIQEQIEEQQASIVDFEQQAIEINEEKNAARARLNEALVEIGNGRAEAQRQLNDELEKLELAVDQAKDELVNIELGFREFVLSRVDHCHEQAEQHRQETYNNYVNAARRGRARYSQASLFRMTGMSVQEIARNQGRSMMNRCMRLRTGAREGNQVTPYGRRYALERDKIRHQRNILNRSIAQMEQKHKEVQEAHLATLASISGAEQAQLSNYQNEVLTLNQRGAALVRQEQAALQNIERLQMESLGLMMDINSMENRVQRGHGDGIRLASDDTVEAYREAHQSMASLEDAARMAEDGAEVCRSRGLISDVLRMFDDLTPRDVASPADLEEPTLDVEVETPDPAPAPEGEPEEVTAGPGETVS